MSRTPLCRAKQTMANVVRTPPVFQPVSFAEPAKDKTMTTLAFTAVIVIFVTLIRSVAIEAQRIARLNKEEAEDRNGD